MKLTKINIDTLVKCMNILGLYYDGIESSFNYLRFTYTGGCLPCSFGSWIEVYEYVNGLVIEDPEKAKAIYNLLSTLED